MTDRASKLVDDMLAEAATVRAEVPDALMAAVLRDAEALQPAAVTQAPASPGLWQMLLETIGGWPTMGGLATAGVAGLWLGVAPPATLEGVTADLIGGNQAVDLFGGDLLTSFAVEEDS